MTKPNMKPYDPEHKGEFCTRDGRPVRILITDRKCVDGRYTIVGLVPDMTGAENTYIWSQKGELYIGFTKDLDLMCVIPKREARVRHITPEGVARNIRTLDSYESREVMPDDIGQEKARAVVEAARKVLGIQHHHELGDALTTLCAALGDDA